MWVQPWQSDCIVEQAAEFIRKKLACRSAGLAPIGQSRGPLRLRAPQTFLRIIFSIPLLSSVRTDQITAQGLHCEKQFSKKPCFQCRLSFMLSLSLTSYTTIPKNSFSHHDSHIKKKHKMIAFLKEETARSRAQSFSQSSKSLFLKAQTMWKPPKPEPGHISVWRGVQQIAAEYSTPGEASQKPPAWSPLHASPPPTAACHCGCRWAAGAPRLEDNHTIWGHWWIYSNTFHNYNHDYYRVYKL